MTPYSGIEPGHIDPGGIEPGGVPSGRVPAGDDPQARPTGADALVGQLAREGVDTVFGIPGLQIYGIVDALGRSASPMRFVVTRHEQSAAYMADGFARVGGGIGVFTVVPGPGVLNTFAALATRGPRRASSAPRG
ncbi:thiamine pyrophosphate-binding protein [Microbacterium sp. NPDC096154]|uniref:thiamine pyrophosphate-binding protein n=1 Tax=Microbacterium sp. NPDC096154 TaxID=3155549 RepID=UPI00333397AD